jgi:3-hydroxyisobutyrate dehydrogenase
MLDAPVSGGTAGAEAGTLTFIVGGEAAALERARPLLEVMGAKVYHAGGNGAGQTAKVCNNMLLAIAMAGTAEALALGVANGLDPAVLSEIMKQSSGGNWCLNVYNPYPGVMDTAPAGRGYRGGFLVDLMNKDLGLAMDTARSSSSPVPMGALAENLFALHRSSNEAGRLDFSSIQWLYQPDLKP